jgi:hypothetical protein
MALDLVRGLSTTSYVSKRLWKTIKMLKEVGPRLGLNINTNNEPSDAHSSAAVAMAGLAGHQVDEMTFSNARAGDIVRIPWVQSASKFVRHCKTLLKRSVPRQLCLSFRKAFVPKVLQFLRA